MSEKLYLYAIINTEETDIPLASGVTSYAPFIIPFRNLGIIASYYGGEEIAVNLDNLSRHEEVISNLLENFCVLPIPFRSIVKCKSKLLDFVCEKYEQFQRNFEELENKYEMGLKVCWDIEKIRYKCNISPNLSNVDSTLSNVASTNESPAKSYFNARIRQYHENDSLLKAAENLRDKILHELDGTFCDSKIQIMYSEKIPISGAFLVEKGKKEQFIETINKRIKTIHNELAFLSSGPWAPYNFVNLSSGGII